MVCRIARLFKGGLRSGDHAELATVCAWLVAILADYMRLIIDRGHLIDELAAAHTENAALRHRIAMMEVPS